MKGLFDVPKGQFGNGDTNGQFRFNPTTQQQERSWIKYADGVYEPERKDGSLRKKKDDHRQFQWWQVNKPADWKPQDEGADFSWNHTLGATDDFANQKTGKPLSSKAGKQKQQVEPLKLDLTPQDGEPFNGKTLLGMGGAAVDAYGADEKETAQPSPRNSVQDAREMEKDAGSARRDNSTKAARRIDQWERETGNSTRDVEAHYRQKPGASPTWMKNELGKTEYYQKRAQDFEERNPGKKAPDYYREYGDKYIKRFDKLKPELSKEGQKWMEKTKDLLQFKMETGLRSGEWDESKPEELKQKAYDSHSEAYLEAGLADLPQEDIDKIITAVDRGDLLLSSDAIREAGETAQGMPVEKVKGNIPAFVKWLISGPTRE